jgi:hypothetical protein
MKGGTQGKNNSPTIEDQHLKQSPLYSLFETWDRLPLSQLVTPTQALRCKEIQYSPPPAGCRAFFHPNWDKTPCILFASPSRLGDTQHKFTRWLRTLMGPNTDSIINPKASKPGNKSTTLFCRHSRSNAP